MEIQEQNVETTSVYYRLARVHCISSIASQRIVNPRPAGPLNFPAPDGGARSLESPPPLVTRLLGHVATRGKRHSKERQNHDETATVIF